ncbi:MAG TPA: glutathione S-transferase family protein [Candidatus Nitrosotenuis sp.]|jgi:glutathione S-transferase|nr:glutathione S-transferase family protein [Candidatus Nitrosotenuis sp.]
MNFIKTLTLATSMMTLIGSFAPQSYAGSMKPTSETAQVKKTVYGVSVSPFVRKVRVVMIEKNLPYELKEVLPNKLLNALKQPIPEDFARVSPAGKIPAYQEGDFSLADSAVIADYLDRAFPGKSLYPTDPKSRAKTEWFHKYADEVVASVVIQKIFIERFVKPKVLSQETNEQIVQEALANELPPILGYLEKEIGDKKWMMGDEFTMADIALGSQFANLKLAGESIDATKYPKLAAYVERIHARDSFKQTM